MCASSASRLCECWLPDERPAPNCVRTVSAISRGAAGHERQLRGLVEQLVEAHAEEVEVHQLDDRPHARHRRADAEARRSRVSEIGVSRTRSPKRSCRPRVSPNTLPPAADVDAGDEHPLVGGELGLERVVDRVHRAEHRRVGGRRRRLGPVGPRRGRRSRAASAAAGVGEPPGGLDGVVELARDRRLAAPRSSSSATPASIGAGARGRASGSRASHSSHLVGRPVALRVALVVAVPAVGRGLDDRRDRAPARTRVDHVVHRRGGRDDVVAVDRDVVDAVAGGALLERRRVLRRRRARTRRSRCSRRRRSPAAATPRRG